MSDTSLVDDLKSCLQDTQELAELAAAIGGDLDEEVAVIDKMEDNITAFMNARMPQGAELLKEAHSLSSTKKNSLFCSGYEKR